jgi:hypothetical protein
MFISRLLASGPALLKSRRPLAFLMLVFALETLCVVGRVARPVELWPMAEPAFVSVERPRGRHA